LRGFGAVTLNGGDLTLHAESAATHFFAGDIGGSGSLVKTGLGTQTLNGVYTFTGDLIIREGTVAIEVMPSIFDWFRFTVKENRDRVNILQFSELALYDTDGTRRNLNLANVTDMGGGDATLTLNPGEVASPEYYSVGNLNENLSKLFDGDILTPNSKWCLNNNIPTLADPATWRTVVMRLAGGTPAIASYNLATANDSPERDPVTWVIEGSPNGRDWITLDAQTGIVATTNRFCWYTNASPFAFATVASLTHGAGTLAIPAGSVVEVCDGATLAISGGTVPIGALRVDMDAGAGTITHFTPTAIGTLHLVNVPNGDPTSWIIPIMFLDVDTPSVLGSWKITADGVPLNGYRLHYDPSSDTLTLDESQQTHTTNTDPPVPFAWLEQYYGTLTATEYEDIAAGSGNNGLDVWESYVAGLIPTDSASRFLITNIVVNAVGEVTALDWMPNYENDSDPDRRVYLIEGKTNLTDIGWHSPTNDGTRFFKVKVRLP